eukprot:6414867-Alexandrium_andersonii.AAC.1
MASTSCPGLQSHAPVMLPTALVSVAYFAPAFRAPSSATAPTSCALASSRARSTRRAHPRTWAQPVRGRA